MCDLGAFNRMSLEFLINQPVRKKTRSYNICINLIPFNTSVDVNDVIEYGTNNLFGLLIQIFHNRHTFYLLFFTLLNFFPYGFT